MDEWYSSIPQQDIDTLKEGQMSGALSSRIAQLFALAQDVNTRARIPIVIDPGDAIFVGGTEGTRISMTLPVAYDVWYLWSTVNIMPENADEAEEFVNLVLAPIFQNHSMIKPLRTVSKDVVSGKDDIYPDIFFFQNKGLDCIKEMRFETFLHDQSPLYVSKGPGYVNNAAIHHEGHGVGDLYCGYLAFPVGPLGVQQVVSVISESLLAKEEYQVEDNSLDPTKAGELLCPMGEQTDDCMGRHLVEKAYILVDRDAEYPAEIMLGQESILPHHWMRLWLDKQGTWPVPGEFIAMIIKPLGLPPHCWWYQLTSPLIYAGQFFETEYYTSGVVLAVISEQDRDWEAGTATYEVTAVSSTCTQRTGHGEYTLSMGQQFENWDQVGNVYKVRVKDQDLYLKSSDFLEYSVDQRVAVRKVPGKKMNFTWDDLEPGRIVPGSGVLAQLEYDSQMSGKDFEISTEWAIVPITFYKE